ncbi:hypothetical protein ACVWWR_007304 [Bradyrhizobium sp. LM3.2]
MAGTTFSPLGTASAPPAAEIVLHVDHQQHVAVGNLHRKVHFKPSRATGAERSSNVDLPGNHRKVRRSARMAAPSFPRMQRFGLVRVD